MKIQRKGLPSPIIFILSFLIIGIAPWARKILRFTYTIITREKAGFYLKILFFITLILFIFLSLKKLGKSQLYETSTLLAFITIPFSIIFFRIKLPEEKIHLIEYFFLGFLLFKDYFKRKISLFLSIFVLFIVATFEEFFQLLLPDRIFDTRDILFNLTGGFTGWTYGNISLKIGGEK
ncbi:MAG: VanZ family protein [Candidatus Aminicenantia bacterium]